MCPALLLCLAIAAPFEDVQHRFHLDLPAAWQFAPQPGDTGGAAFRREQDGIFANAMVRVMDLPPGTPLPAFAARVRAASEGEPGYRSLRDEPCTSAGVPAVCRRFVSLINGDPKLVKMAEQRILMVAGEGFVIHAETLADGFAVFEPDILRLVASFQPGPLARAAPPAPPQAEWSDLIGTWRSSKGHLLELTRAGTIIIDGHHGTYKFEVGNLICQLDDGMAVFSLDLQGKRLLLSGGMFGEGEPFARAEDRARPKAKPNRARRRP